MLRSSPLFRLFNFRFLCPVGRSTENTWSTVIDHGGLFKLYWYIFVQTRCRNIYELSARMFYRRVSMSTRLIVLIDRHELDRQCSLLFFFSFSLYIFPKNAIWYSLQDFNRCEIALFSMLKGILTNMFITKYIHIYVYTYIICIKGEK